MLKSVLKKILLSSPAICDFILSLDVNLYKKEKVLAFDEPMTDKIDDDDEVMEDREFGGKSGEMNSIFTDNRGESYWGEVLHQKREMMKKYFNFEKFVEGEEPGRKGELAVDVAPMTGDEGEAPGKKGELASDDDVRDWIVLNKKVDDSMLLKPLASSSVENGMKEANDIKRDLKSKTYDSLKRFEEDMNKYLVSPFPSGDDVREWIVLNENVDSMLLKHLASSGRNGHDQLQHLENLEKELGEFAALYNVKSSIENVKSSIENGMKEANDIKIDLKSKKYDCNKEFVKDMCKYLDCPYETAERNDKYLEHLEEIYLEEIYSEEIHLEEIYLELENVKKKKQKIRDALTNREYFRNPSQVMYSAGFREKVGDYLRCPGEDFEQKLQFLDRKKALDIAVRVLIGNRCAEDELRACLNAYLASSRGQAHEKLTHLMSLRDKVSEPKRMKSLILERAIRQILNHIILMKNLKTNLESYNSDEEFDVEEFVKDMCKYLDCPYETAERKDKYLEHLEEIYSELEKGQYSENQYLEEILDQNVNVIKIKKKIIENALEVFRDPSKVMYSDGFREKVGDYLRCPGEDFEQKLQYLDEKLALDTAVLFLIGNNCVLDELRACLFAYLASARVQPHEKLNYLIKLRGTVSEPKRMKSLILERAISLWQIL